MRRLQSQLHTEFEALRPEWDGQSELAEEQTRLSKKDAAHKTKRIKKKHFILHFVHVDHIEPTRNS